MVPTYFEKTCLSKQENTALSAGNVRSLLRSLDGYFKTVLKKTVSVNVNINKIGKSVVSPGTRVGTTAKHNQSLADSIRSSAKYDYTIA